MSEKKNICICGGGSLGHVIAAVLSHKGHCVNLLTNRPGEWNSTIYVTDCNNKTIEGVIHTASDKPEDVIPSADIILLCIPGFLVEQMLRSVKPYVSSEAKVGSVVCSNGFFWIAKHILGSDCRLFGFQRVPYICRVTEYGKSAAIKGYKSILKIAGCPNVDLSGLTTFFSQMFDTPASALGHYLEATLTNSNPLLHPTRIYGMLSKQPTDAFDKEFFFYEEWDDFSSETLINCDNEFQQIVRQIPINHGEIPSILKYYESTDTPSLTRKIRSITAFKEIKMSMIAKDGKYYADYSNRYFTEDIPFGLLIIKSIAAVMGKDTPSIDTVLLWMQEKMQKEYLSSHELKGKDLSASGIIQNFGIHTLDQLLRLP
ncbi:MAG: NAD/NADP octopine/nopaline dehydrogenase family protein [Tannerellaceae bacterium]|jgi:hypothetical protein|nr:NAD/NADP octopine/nopaline dehydrogenase family protein [Tannerellaceae bacterium]